MKKRLLSVLLACGMALTLLPAAAFAEDSAEPAETPVCVCETACEADSFNADCPVCGAEGAQVPDCGKYVVATETPAPPVETSEIQAEEPAEPEAPVELTAAQKVQALIDALPDAENITAENRADVEAQLTAIDEAKLPLEDEWDALDFTKYQAAINALDTLDGQAGASEPEMLYDLNYIVAVGNGEGNWLNGESWTIDAESNRMTEVEPGIWEITYNGVEASEFYQVKFACNGSWEYAWSIDGVLNGWDNPNREVSENGSRVTLRIDVNGFDFEKVTDSVETAFIVTAPGEILTEVSTAEDLKAAVENGGNIALTNDVTLTDALDISKDVTLDLNGHTLTRPSNASAVIVNSGNSLTLTDSSKAGTGKVTSSCKAVNVRGGSLILESGTISCTSDSGYAINADPNSTVTLKGGTVSATSGCNAIVLYKGDSSNNAPILYADGGTVEGPVISRDGTITHSNDNVTTVTTFTGTVQNGGLIEWGTFNGSVENSCEDFRGTISGGTFYGTVTNSEGTISDTAKVTVSFVSNGGSEVAEQKILKGQTVEQPADPTKEGVAFLGWYTDADCTEAYDFGKPVTENLTLYAAWKEIINVPYTTTVTLGDNTAPGEATFELEAFDFWGSPLEDVTISGSVETNGVGSYPNHLTITGLQSEVERIEFFFVRQKQGAEANWTYDDTVYCVQRVWERDEPSILSTEDAASIEFEIYATEYVDKMYIPLEDNTTDMAFENVYTLHTHVHSYSQQYDEKQHWDECGCGDKQNEELHQFGAWTVTKEATETEEGEQERACSLCPYKQTEVIPMLPHTHQYDQQYDADSHWMECPCGDIQELEPHQFGEWVVTREPTMDELGEQERVCSVCGYSETEDLPVLVEDEDEESSNNSSNSNKTGSTGSTKTGSPKTGDKMSLGTMVAALVLSGAAIIALAVTGKKYGEHQ